MTDDRRFLACALCCVVLVAACGSSSAGATPSAAAGSSVTGSARPGGTATATPAISAPSGSATDLEAMIPGTVGGMTLLKTSFDYASNPAMFAEAPFRTNGLDAFLKSHGKTIADVRYASGQGPDAGALVRTSVIAVQVRGVAATAFADQLSNDYSTLVKNGFSSTHGGKKVVWVTAGGSGSATYLHNDIVFLVQGSEANANSILQQLP